MASADWTIKQGDDNPVFSDTLTLSDGTVPNLTGATLQLVIRNASSAPITLTGTATIVNPSTGSVQYSPSIGDTAIPGSYQGSWIVGFAGGGQMTFPTEGYISIEIEPALSSTSVPQLLVDLETVKRYPGMSIPANDRYVDSRLTDFIRAAQPLIEQVTGPIITRTFDEYYPGGNNIISLSHRPSVGYGMTPILNVLACSEFLGPTEYPLAQVQNPAMGTIWSYEVNTRLGTITRRTSGGGSIAFPAGHDAVRVIYQSGQQEVPWNVREATLELIRVNWQTTQPVGRGRLTQADTLDTGAPLGFFMPRRVRELLSPGRRAPSIA